MYGLYCRIAMPIVSEVEVLGGLSHTSVVTPDQAVDGVIGGGEFNFNFDQLDLFATGTAAAVAAHPESLSLPLVPSRVEDYHHHQQQQHHHPGSGIFAPADSWNHHHNQHQHHHLLPSSSSEAFTAGVTPASVFSQHPDHLSPSSPALSGNPTGRSGIPHTGHIITSSPDKRQKSSRPRHTRRQITLRHTALRQATHFNARETSSVSWMAQLSDINGRLLDLSSKLSQVQEIAQKGGDANVIPGGFPIDQMFQITREVADILDQLAATTVSDDAAKAQQARQDVADPANSMLVLSIYVRLLDMYQHVFDLVQAELSQTVPGPDAAFRFWKLPDVTVGSFAVESSPSLQMSLTIQLAEDFLLRLSGATADVNSSVRNGDMQQPADGFAGAIEGSYDAVKGKEENLRKHLVHLRAEIEALLDD